MRHAGYVVDRFDSDVERTKSTDSRVTAKANTFDKDIGGLEAVLLLGCVAGTFAGDLSRVSGAFLGAAEAAGARTAVRQRAAVSVSKRNDSVVEGREHVNLAICDGSLALFLLGYSFRRCSCSSIFCHSIFPSPVLRLARCFRLCATDCDTTATAGSGVSLGALASARQITLVAFATVAADVLEALDVTGNHTL